MKGLGNIQGMMKKMQDVQAKMAGVQEQLKTKEVTGTAGGGMVSVKMNGAQIVTEVKISQEVTGEDREMIEDLVMAAVNDATKKVQDMVASEMQKITGGINIPGLF